MGNIVGAIVLGVIAIICFVFSYLQFNEKGFLFNEEFTVRIPFTHESWNGRMKACRGIGASLTEKEISMWEQEHRTLLEHIAPNEFDILHYGAIAELKKH